MLGMKRQNVCMVIQRLQTVSKHERLWSNMPPAFLTVQVVSIQTSYSWQTLIAAAFLLISCGNIEIVLTLHVVCRTHHMLWLVVFFLFFCCTNSKVVKGKVLAMFIFCCPMGCATFVMINCLKITRNQESYMVKWQLKRRITLNV